MENNNKNQELENKKATMDRRSSLIKRQQSIISYQDKIIKENGRIIKKNNKVLERLFSLVDQIETIASKSIYKNPLQKLKNYKKMLSSFHQTKNTLPKEKSTADHMKNININNQYTVVSAVYNVEAYLEEFFESLVNQSIGFEDHIRLIMVDDGSPDNSADIIQKWRDRYPNNIFYYKKENGGAASARNYGLQFCSTEWITFIDPDDFVDVDYFAEIQTFEASYPNKYFSMISCNLIFYIESDQTYKDTHPMRYRYLEGEKIVSDNDLEGMLQLSASHVFLRCSIIKENLLKFDERIIPNFEDAHFIGKYLLSLEETSIGFIQNAKYYYRKRSSGDSALDTSWSKPELFDDGLKYGSLDLLQQAKQIKGYVPEHTQRTVLYHLSWFYMYLFNSSERISFLNDKQVANFKSLLQEIFEYIDIQTIQRFNIAGFWLFHKIGLLGMQKKVDNSSQTFIIADYDEVKSQIQIRYIHYFQHDVIFLRKDKEIFPQFSKTLKTYFLDDIFIYETMMWLSVENGDSLIIKIKDAKTQIFMGGKAYGEKISLPAIKSYFNEENIIDTFTKENGLIRDDVLNEKNRKKYKDAWLLMDRDTQADDNAEHLYRYIMHTHPEINSFFCLRRESLDWDRLSKEGFRLIAFDSYEHKLVYLYAKHLISSHIDEYVISYLPAKWDKDIPRRKYTFLQHGVIQNNLSKWLNGKNIDCFITTSKREYTSIVDDGSPYKFTKREVALTGSPRHDSLLSGKDKMEKLILIMPTWRKYLAGEVVGKGNTKLINNEFKESAYCIKWSAILQSKSLLELSNEYGYNIVFFPHANIQPYLDIFDVPKYIEVLSHDHGSIQNLFQKSALMITDYSSVAFEMGMLEREVIYYQFDHQRFFEGDHVCQKGYFDYTTDGFGPLCHTEKEVMDELKSFLDSGGRTRGKYLKRIRDFFEFQDMNNCQRVFNVIKKLDMKNTSQQTETIYEK